jgi:HEAT repeat protein
MTDRETTDIRGSIEQLAAGDADRRAEAAEMLCRAGSSAAQAAVPLVRACADDDDRVREWAVAALEELGPPASSVLPQLIELAASGHPLVAYWATTLLGRSGHDAAKAVPILVKSLESAGDAAVAQRAAWALGKIGPAAAGARAALEKAAGGADPRLARLAREALDAIGT